jgi:UPF0716 family protein affecting phage T7 exclusion
LIGVFAASVVIRGFLGDVLVIVLLYCLIKTFIRHKLRWLWLYLFGFAVLVEIAQLFQIADWLGINNPLLRTVLGATFDLWDIVAYGVGSLTILSFEVITRRCSTQEPPEAEPRA